MSVVRQPDSPCRGVLVGLRASFAFFVLNLVRPNRALRVTKINHNSPILDGTRNRTQRLPRARPADAIPVIDPKPRPVRRTHQQPIGIQEPIRKRLQRRPLMRARIGKGPKRTASPHDNDVAPLRPFADQKPARLSLADLINLAQHDAAHASARRASVTSRFRSATVRTRNRS